MLGLPFLKEFARVLILNSVLIFGGPVLIIRDHSEMAVFYKQREDSKNQFEKQFDLRFLPSFT